MRIYTCLFVLGILYSVPPSDGHVMFGALSCRAAAYKTIIITVMMRVSSEKCDERKVNISIHRIVGRVTINTPACAYARQQNPMANV